MFKVNKKKHQNVIDVVLVFLLLLWTYLTTFSSVSIVDFEQVNVSWVVHQLFININYIILQQSPDMARPDKHIESQ